MKLAIFILLLAKTIFLPLWSPGLVVFWPSILALALAILTRRPALSLATGALTGAVYLNLDQPAQILSEWAGTHFLGSIASPWNISILLFTLTFGGFAGILQYGGGLSAIAQRILAGSRNQNDQRSIEQSAFFLGLICFFDGLVNSMLVGRLFRPLAERYQVSTARLAYIVDSTSSPIACLSIASTWIAYQLSMIQEGLTAAELTLSPYLLYLGSWPANFYCLFSLILLFSTIRHHWQIGPMKDFQNAAASSSEPVSDSTPATASPAMTAAVSSLAVLLVTLLGGLFLDGMLRSPQGTPWVEIIARADASAVLLIVALVAAASAYLIHRKLLPDHSTKHGLEQAFWEGSAQMMRPLTVLLAAWALSSTLKELGTAAAISSLLSTNLSPSLLPVAIFICGSGISFFTGTSWGTMGILTPLAIPVAIHMSPDAATDPSLICFTIAAVFSGAVFGDHCSPLSDTTIVSSVACGVDPMDHVRTQIPYALLAAVWACLFGFLPLAFGFSPWLGISLGGILLLILPNWCQQFKSNSSQ
ncbi:MAG: Na+/H+ antiporter NhaC family protein [Verrucomicrobiota bacterium]